MYLIPLIILYASGIVLAVFLTIRYINTYNNAEKRRRARQAAYKAELEAVGYRIKREMLRDAAMAEPLPNKKTVNITSKGIMADMIAEAFEKHEDLNVRRILK